MVYAINRCLSIYLASHFCSLYRFRDSKSQAVEILFIKYVPFSIHVIKIFACTFTTVVGVGEGGEQGGGGGGGDREGWGGEVCYFH